MNLSDFVQDSLTQIARGIEGASVELKGTDALINPRKLVVNAGSGPNYGYVTEGSDHRRVVELVEFDVAITVSDGNEKNGKIGISVGSIGIGAGAKNSESNSSQTRMRFKVPVAWPNA